MHPLASAILITWRRNGAYALRLVGDLAPEQFAAQPVPGRVMNHPAWILSHLNVYAPICSALIRAEPFADPIDHPHGPKSEVAPTGYPPPDRLLRAYEASHAEAEQALTRASPEALAAATPLARWHTLHPTVGDMLVTLMVKHESHHLGQLSAWRRAMGLARVEM
jgi:uncharacterized damage-inducible protein DinB